MSTAETFPGFPAIGRATALPNLFFAAILPRLQEPGSLLAFLWTSRLLQEQRGDARFATADQVWAQDGAAASFCAMGGGRPGLDRGLASCTDVGALIALDLVGAGGPQRAFFLNDPGSRRAAARARAGEVVLLPGTAAREVVVESRPGIFRLYEENIGTMTPLVGERLAAAADLYPWEWIVDAFREAAELNRRNWRYIERILQNREAEGSR